MFPKKYRLPMGGTSGKRAEKVFPTAGFLLRVFANGGTANRFAAVVSKKVSLRAARRNFWKRFFSGYFAELPAAGKDYLIIVSAPAEKIGKEIVKSDLEKIFKNRKTGQ